MFISITKNQIKIQKLNRHCDSIIMGNLDKANVSKDLTKDIPNINLEFKSVTQKYISLHNPILQNCN